MNRVRCFNHTLQLSVKALLRLFTVRKDDSNEDEELGNTEDGTYYEGFEEDDEGEDEGEDDEDGKDDEDGEDDEDPFESLSDAEKEELLQNTEEVRKTIEKVSPSMSRIAISTCSTFFPAL